MARYERTETVILSLDIKTNPGEILTDPGTLPTVTVTAPDGVVVVTPVNMTKIAVGQYTHDYTPAAAAVLGWYRTHYIMVDAGRTIIDDDGFELGA